MNLPTGHSPLGASSSHRFMSCPGSVELSQGLVDDESDFALLGTAAHAVGELCLNSGEDAWECIGMDYVADVDHPDAGDALTVDKDMADAVQVYLDAVRKAHPDRNQGNFFVEKRFHCPSIHPLMYGTSDAVYIGDRVLHVWDYKHGAGIMVEPINNPQLMYYACGVLTYLGLWEQIDRVVLHVAQPRGFVEPKCREWELGTGNLYLWLNSHLIPAMVKAEGSRETASGEHCRFCPARSRACPQLEADMDELERMLDMPAAELTPERLAHRKNLFLRAKIVNAADDKTAFAMLQSGKVVPGWKLAKNKVNREFKEEAEAEAKAKFGDDAYTKPKLKSPAQIDALPEGPTFTARWAFKPEAGLGVVPADDARPAVSKDTKSMFEAATKKRKTA